MATAAETSALGLEMRRISAGPGSPYYKIDVIIHAGGRELVPMQLIHLVPGRDYRGSYMDDHSVTVKVGSGTAVFDIGPYQDDLTITIKRYRLSGAQSEELGAVESRTYTAYLTDDLPRGPMIASAPQFSDRETANRNKSLDLTFVLEEVAMTQLRKMSIGMIVRATPPYMVMKTVLHNALDSIQVDLDSKIVGFQMEEASNQAPREHIVIPDGTPLVDLPDLLQNERGGIYSSGLGFYIQGPYVYAWPVYDTKRHAKARRILQIFLSPTANTTGVDKTWLDDGRIVSVWSSRTPQLLNDSLDILNTEGNATRFADAERLIGGMGEVKDNKYTMNRSKNNSEFATKAVGNGANYAKVSGVRFSANPYVETSKMARRSGQFLLVPWDHSNPDILVPSMMVEVFYDAGGEIRKMEGCLTGNHSKYTLQGKGMTNRAMACTTMIEVFLDRDDPDFKAFLEKGGNLTSIPQISAL